jgi:hypothetical protein
MEYFEDSNPPTNREIGYKMPFLDGHLLFSGYILTAVLTDISPLLDNFRTERALPGEVTLMDLAYGSGDCVLQNLVAHPHAA